MHISDNTTCSSNSGNFNVTLFPESQAFLTHNIILGVPGHSIGDVLVPCSTLYIKMVAITKLIQISVIILSFDKLTQYRRCIYVEDMATLAQFCE